FVCLTDCRSNGACDHDFTHDKPAFDLNLTSQIRRDCDPAEYHPRIMPATCRGKCHHRMDCKCCSNDLRHNRSARGLAQPQVKQDGCKSQPRDARKMPCKPQDLTCEFI